MNTRIYNGTPHNINIIAGATFDPSIRKYKGGEIAVSIPSDGMLNAQMEMEVISDIADIPVCRKNIVSCDALPDGYDIYIVSAIYGIAYRQIFGERRCVYTISDPVVADDGITVVGCCGLMEVL